MAVYVDDAQISWRGRAWCHLVADSLDELHAFAEELGLKRAWFQDRASYPHYDVTMAVRLRALRLGARSGDKKTVLDCCKRLKFELHAEDAHRQPTIPLVMAS